MSQYVKQVEKFIYFFENNLSCTAKCAMCGLILPVLRKMAAQSPFNFAPTI